MEGTNRSIDLLSELPDDVLCHILSFLPTKTSVSTGLFAKRWRFLWPHVPNLLFFGDNLDNINKVIMLHEAKLVNTFRLYKVESSTYQLETLIIYSITRGVRYLYLDFDYKYEDEIVCTFPRLLLTCKTLVELKLVNCGVIPSTGELFLPSLKKLNLTYVDYEDDESLPHLISGCPVLEELIVNDCYRKEEKCSGCVNVSSPTVKMLTVDFSKGDDQFCEKMLIIDFPALVYLKVDSINLEWFKSLRKPMTSLVDVEIILNGDWSAHGIKYTVRSRSIELLSCLCHVKYLKIASYFDEALIDIEGTGSMPKFVNLTKLELVLAVNWYNVVKFLEVADNLQVLVIQISKTLPYKEPERVPTCMLSRLRTVRMYCFNACEDAFDVVRYILKNAQVLERMEISPTPRSSEEKVDALQRISLFERVPKSCQVAFNTDEYVKDVIDELKRKEREIEEKRERERSR